MKKILVVALVVAIALIGVTAAFAGNHTSMTCRTCHTPHHGDSTTFPIWDTTTTWGAKAGSAICEACHDGVGYTMTTGVSDIWAAGQTGNHPVGFTADGKKGTTAAASATGDTSSNILYYTGKVECRSCHYVHNDPAKSTTKYVRTYAGATTFCGACHTNW